MLDKFLTKMVDDVVECCPPIPIPINTVAGWSEHIKPYKNEGTSNSTL